jgi:hypothetical protein
MRRHGFEAQAELLLRRDLPFEALDVIADEPLRIEVLPHQQLPDLLERKPELPERQHLLQTNDLFPAVQTVSGHRSVRRGDETDLVVVVQRTDRDPRALRELANLHEGNVDPHVA